jgi:hypothetical protein
MSDDPADSDYRNVVYSRVANAVHAELRAGVDRGILDIRGDHELAKPRAGEKPPDRLRGIGWRARLLAAAYGTFQKKRGKKTTYEDREVLTYEWERVDHRKVAEDFPRGEEVTYTTLANDEPPLLAAMLAPARRAAELEREMTLATATKPESIETLAAAIGETMKGMCFATAIIDGEAVACARVQHFHEDHVSATGHRWPSSEEKAA